MKSRFCLVLFVSCLLTACSGAPNTAPGSSYRAQLFELGERYCAGTISEQEYHSSKKLLFKLMMH